MTIKIRRGRNKKARSNGSRILLEHLKPEEAAEVLRRMLKARPDLANEAGDALLKEAPSHRCLVKHRHWTSPSLAAECWITRGNF